MTNNIKIKSSEEILEHIEKEIATYIPYAQSIFELTPDNGAKINNLAATVGALAAIHCFITGCKLTAVEIFTKYKERNTDDAR